jgi:predicted ABC-type transport system involved in lysophospholipase L1 biosynthesis ATPase subunit
MSAALLELEQVRCELAGVTLLDSVTLRTSGGRVGIAGKTTGIAALLTGEAALVRGHVNVCGQPLAAARDGHVFGCAVAPGQVPKHWTVRRVLELAAQIAGHSPRDATARARASAESLGEAPILKRRWAHAAPVEQAIATLALGLVTDPTLLYVQLPIGQLADAPAARYSAALERATEGRSLLAEVVCLPESAAELAWVESLQSMSYVFDDSFAGNGGPPSRAQVRYLLRVIGDVGRVAPALIAAALPAAALHAPHDAGRGYCALLVDVPRDARGLADTGPLLDVCVNLNVTVVELLPV